MNFWRDKRVVVTGGRGFLGSHVVDKILARGCFAVFAPPKTRYDLRRRDDVELLYANFDPDIVINLAASCGGIGASSANPGKFLYDNLMIGLEMMDVAREEKIEKFVQIGSVCSYPSFSPSPMKETDLWNGYPEVTNAPYGIAKRVLMTMCQSYRQQYGLNAIGLMPVNLYGPRDSFNPARSHAIPALIRKCLEAKEAGEDQIVVWGTGKASREFLYVEDCAEAIVLATEFYNKPEPVNLGTGIEILIKDLVPLIADATGFKGSIFWDSTKPDGQLRRCLDVSTAEREFGFRAKKDFAEGVRETVEWYLRGI